MRYFPPRRHAVAAFVKRLNEGFAKHRRAVAAATVGAMALAWVPLTAVGAAADPVAPFNECPAVGFAHSCAVLLVVETDGTVHVLSDSSSGNPYENADDTTVGILNLSDSPVPNIILHSTSTPPIFQFDGDGICSGPYNGVPNPAGCPFDANTAHPGHDYAGPGITYTNISPAPNQTTGTVNFAQSCAGNTAASCAPSAGGVNPGQSAFFALESDLSGATITIPKANPTIPSTTPSPSVQIGGGISDTATLAGGRVPGGTLTFQLFGPGDTSCATAINTASVPVHGNGAYASPTVTPTAIGTYNWRVSYSGDANNNPAGPTACGSESVNVNQATPSISTTASGSVAVGGNISDSATLSGGFNPTGTVTFKLYGPGDTTCSTAIATSTATVNGNGTYHSAVFTTGAVGTYNWTASYGGDADNAAAGPTACGDESVTVIKASPSITTTASGTVPAGGKISDTATLSGGFNPTGTVTFKLYGPGDTTCSTAIATSTATVNGNGTYHSAVFTTGAVGTYNWTASYSGDVNNNPAGPTACGAEPVNVTPQVLTGRAYGLSANATALGLPLLTIAPTPDTGPVSVTSNTTVAPPCVITISGLINSANLCAKVVTTETPSSSTANASVDSTSIGLPGVPVIQVGAVQSQSNSVCAGSSGSTTIAFLKVGGVTVIASPTPIAPNTKISVLGVNLTLNEQTPVPGGLTVNAVHVNINALGLSLVTADTVIASSTSDIHNCP